MGVREFGVKGHLVIKWGHCWNTLKMLLRQQFSMNFDRGTFGVFRVSECCQGSQWSSMSF